MLEIPDLLQKKDRIIVAIDGRCAAGKSTLADKLSAMYDGAVIRMDHFFVPPSLRDKERINLHFERFEEEVIAGLRSGDAFTYRIFNCKAQCYDRTVSILQKRLIIVEGAYSMLPQFERIYDYTIFADISAQEQKMRIINRNGLEVYVEFRDKWIPAEERYFEQFAVKQKCNYVFRSDI